MLNIIDAELNLPDAYEKKKGVLKIFETKGNIAGAQPGIFWGRRGFLE